MSELVFCFESDDPEFQRPITIDDLGKLLESKVNEINIDNGKDWCVLAVDHDSTYRNTDKDGGGYVKFYPHCKSISKDMSDKFCYRVIIDDEDTAVYTVHNGKGQGKDYMPMSDREMLTACFNLDVYVDGVNKMKLRDMFRDELKTGTNHTFTLTPIDAEKTEEENKEESEEKSKGKKGKKNKNKEKKETIKVSTKDIRKRVKGTDLEKYLGIEYDGKRKL